MYSHDCMGGSLHRMLFAQHTTSYTFPVSATKLTLSVFNICPASLKPSVWCGHSAGTALLWMKQLSLKKKQSPGRHVATIFSIGDRMASRWSQRICYFFCAQIQILVTYYNIPLSWYRRGQCNRSFLFSCHLRCFPLHGTGVAGNTWSHCWLLRSHRTVEAAAESMVTDNAAHCWKMRRSSVGKTDRRQVYRMFVCWLGLSGIVRYCLTRMDSCKCWHGV